jgi:outer membrane protein TolC
MKRAGPRVALPGLALLAVLAVLAVTASAAAADHPLRLDEAVQLALAGNENAKIADALVLVADAAVEKARTAFLPLVTATATDTARPGSVQKAGAVVLPANIGTGNATIAQPLLNASAFPLLRQAERLLDAQRASSTDAKRLLAFNAATQFFQTLSAEEVLEAARRSAKVAKDNLDDSQARVDAQLNSSNDVTRAHLDYANALQQIALNEGVVQRSYVELSFVLNAAVQGPLAPPAATIKAASAAPPKLDDLIAVGVHKRPDLLALHHAARAAHLFAQEPLLRLVPTVGLAAVVSGNSNSSTGKTFDETLAGTVTWTIYDSGVRYADKHSRDASADIADLDYDLLVRSIANDVRSAVATLVASQNAMRFASDAVADAQKSVEETATLYHQGLAKEIELTTANDSEFGARVGYVSAELATALAYLALRQAMGLDPLGTELR